jgi:DNA processing protein
VEAAWRSGSLITARAAVEQGRDVMAAPGHPLDPRSRGGNALLKEGAALVETAQDILAVLNASPTRVRPAPAAPLFEPIDAASGLAERLAALLSTTPVHVNDLARDMGAPLAQIAAALTELELEGKAATLAGGYATSAAP